MGAGWDSEYPKDNSSQQDSPLAALFLALKSLRNRTCGTQPVLGMKESMSSPGFLELRFSQEEASWTQRIWEDIKPAWAV